MLHCAKVAPEPFFATCARLMLRDVQLSIEQQFPGGLDATDISILKAIRESVPNAGGLSPQEVLEYVRDTLRAASATTTIEASSVVQTDDNCV